MPHGNLDNPQVPRAGQGSLERELQDLGYRAPTMLPPPPHHQFEVEELLPSALGCSCSWGGLRWIQGLLSWNFLLPFASSHTHPG